jgi:hypothetical protein
MAQKSDKVPTVAEIVQDISKLFMWDCLPTKEQEKHCRIVKTGGCLKFNECDLREPPQQDKNCYMHKNGWCEQLIRTRKRSILPNPTGIRTYECKDCTHQLFHRDCYPCPYYGCIIPNEEINSCPYTVIFKERGNFSNSKLNQYSRIWCYLTRRKFRDFQHKNHLWAASFLYREILSDPPESYYLMKNTIAPLQFLSTHFKDKDKLWEPISDEQIRWHVISDIREKDKSNLKQFKILEEFKRLTALEKKLGVIIVEDGEFSFFLLLWRLKRLSAAPEFDLLDIGKKVTIDLLDPEKKLLKSLKEKGLENDTKSCWLEINQNEGTIRTSIIDELITLGLLDSKRGHFRATERLLYLLDWIYRHSTEESIEFESIFNIHLNFSMPNDLAIKIHDRNSKLDAGDITSFVNAILSSIPANLSIEQIEANARFPLIGHFYIRRGFATSIHWILFPVMYYDENHPRKLIPDPSGKVPIGLFIGLFHCSYNRFNTTFFTNLYNTWIPIIDVIKNATNQYFLENIIEDIKPRLRLAVQMGRLQHELNNSVELFSHDIAIDTLQTEVIRFRDEIGKLLISWESRPVKFSFKEIIPDELIDYVRDKTGTLPFSEIQLFGFSIDLKWAIAKRYSEARQKAEAVGKGQNTTFDISIIDISGKRFLEIIISNPGRFPENVITFNKTRKIYKSTNSNRPARGIPLCYEAIEYHNGIAIAENSEDGSKDGMAIFSIQLPIYSGGQN